MGGMQAASLPTRHPQTACSGWNAGLRSVSAASNHSAFIIRTYANAGDIFISLVFFASFAGKKHQRNDISRSAEGEKALSA